MQILIAIANYGERHNNLCQSLISEYREWGYETHIVVLSDTPKDYGSDVEVLVGLPNKNHWSLPFGHKKIFFQHRMDYDVFIYSEDDVLIRKRNIKAFLEVTSTLPPERIAGFLRYEEDRGGKKYVDSVHGSYHWDVDSIEVYRDEIFAFLTNEHSACYIMTRRQLLKAIESGGFLVPPHSGKYDLLCTAANDPYTQCGFKKLICISRMDDFLVHHLPNNYVNHVGRSPIFALSYDELMLEIREMIRSQKENRPLQTLDIRSATRWEFLKKAYHRESDDETLGLVPDVAQNILSVGAALGSTERKLLEKGKTVWAVPIDDVMSALLRAKGIRVASPNISSSMQELSDAKFDLLLALNIIEYYVHPSLLLATYMRLLKQNGSAIVSVPNHSYAGYLFRRICRRSDFSARRDLADFAEAGVHYVTLRRAKYWIRTAGMSVTRVIPVYLAKWKKFPTWMLRPLAIWLAESFVILAANTGPKRDLIIRIPTAPGE